MSEPDTEKFDVHELYELKVIEAVDENPTLSNRKVATKLGVSVKLAHEILSKMVSKGIFHVKKHHARRWDYFLTPKGIKEKTRLTMEFLDFSMHFYREARRQSAQVCRDLSESGVKNIAFLGAGDLAEIVYLGVQEWGLELNNVYTLADEIKGKFMNLPVTSVIDGITNDKNEVIIICLYDKTKPKAKSYLPKGIEKSDKFRWIF